MTDQPAYTPARLTRSIARYITARADEIRTEMAMERELSEARARGSNAAALDTIRAKTALRRELAAALVAYWEAAALKASGR